MLSVCQKGLAMGKLVLFSQMQGVVTLAGAPVPGAVLEREFRWAWKRETGTETTETDAAGRFRFPAIERSSFLGFLLPHEPNVRQTVLIRHGGKSFKAWMFDKGNYRANGEVGKPIVMTCRLDSEPAHDGDVFGICELR